MYTCSVWSITAMQFSRCVHFLIYCSYAHSLPWFCPNHFYIRKSKMHDPSYWKNIFRQLVIFCDWGALVRNTPESLMDQRQSFLCRDGRTFQKDRPALHPSCPYGAGARQKPLLNKWHMTAFLKITKCHLKDSNHKSFFILWPEC